jgi:pyruvate formate lyase activating enzyme
MRLAGLVRTSTVDFPGRLSAVVFTSGCNFNCFYCHNRSLIHPDQPDLDLNSVLSFLYKRRGLLDGVVISGGEPLLHSDLKDFIKEMKQMDYAVKLDTNGSKPISLETLVSQKLVDYIAMDYKAPWPLYPEISACQNHDVKSVQDSLRLLISSGVRWEIRTTVCPQLTQDDLMTMAESVPVLSAWYIQSYHRPSVYRPEDEEKIKKAPYTSEQLARMTEKLKSRQPAVCFRSALS